MLLRPPLEAERVDNILICRLSGDLTSVVLNRLKVEVARQAKEKQTYRVVLNLHEVDYISSKDLGVFVQLYRFLESEKTQAKSDAPAVLAFCSLNAFVQDIIELTKLESIFPIFVTEEDAVATLNKPDYSPPAPPA
jgi:anti-anti-sigma factor